MDFVTLGVLMYVLGTIGNVVLPFLMTVLEEPGTKFEWRFAISKSLGALGVAAVAIATPGFVELLAQTAALYEGYTFLYALAVVVIAAGGGQIGRFVDKYVPVLRNKLK